MDRQEGKLIIAKESGHWYDVDGNPAYTQPNKSRPGEMRPTTVRDARKLGLVPSVTVIISQMAKPGLDIWKQNQILLAAATTPHKRSEMSADDWIKIVLKDSQDQAKKAAEKGTFIHADIERFCRAEYVNPENEARCLNVLDALNKFGIDTVDITPEKTFASTLGFGGKMDLPALEKDFIADIKTTEFHIRDGVPYKRGEKARLYWPEHLLQLAGYKIGNCKVPRPINLVNIYVSTIDDSVYWHQWDNEAIKNAEREFILLIDLWYLRNNGGRISGKM